MDYYLVNRKIHKMIDNQDIINKAEEALDKEIVAIEFPKQGADNFVFFIIDDDGKEYTIKTGSDVTVDIKAIELLEKNNLSGIYPKLVKTFESDNRQYIIIERLKGALYRFIRKEYKNLFIDSLIDTMTKVHSVKSKYAGLITWQDKKMSWKEFLVYKYSGDHPWYSWAEIEQRKGVNTKLLNESIKRLIDLLGSTDLSYSEYSLLHTDINQGNVFVNINSKKVVGLVDWSEATFGDPLYDFARLRLNIWHNFNEDAERIYFNVNKFTDKQKKLENLYFLMHVVDYINWFSESHDVRRLELHQDYLNNEIN